MMRVLIGCFGWHLIIVGALAEDNSSTQGSLLDKQHDYILKFGRIEAFRYDERYIKSLNLVTFKYNRTTAVVNGSVEFKQNAGSQLEVICQAYKFASNEYRHFPMRFQINFCQAVNKNVMGLSDFRKCGTFRGCPLVKDKTYSICNWSPDPSKFPPLIPSGEYMLEFQAVYRSVEFFIVRAYLSISRPIAIKD